MLPKTPSRLRRPNPPIDYITQEFERLHSRCDRLEALSRRRSHSSPAANPPRPQAPVTIHLCVTTTPDRDYAFGAIIGDPVGITARSVFMERTANRASIVALGHVLPLTGNRPVIVISNNFYLADVLAHGWLPEWERNRWRDTVGARRPNCDLWSDPDLLQGASRVIAAEFVRVDDGSPELDDAYQLALSIFQNVEVCR